jgi:hypothetical protein
MKLVRMLRMFPFVLFSGWYLRKYFANLLQFTSWQEMSEFTFPIYQIPEEAHCYATLLPNKKWAIWDDNQEPPPYSFQIFSNWKEAIGYCRAMFKKQDIDKGYWNPCGYNENDDEFTIPPNPDKKNTCKYSL